MARAARITSSALIFPPPSNPRSRAHRSRRSSGPAGGHSSTMASSSSRRRRKSGPAPGRSVDEWSARAGFCGLVGARSAASASSTRRSIGLYRFRPVRHPLPLPLAVRLQQQGLLLLRFESGRGVCKVPNVHLPFSSACTSRACARHRADHGASRSATGPSHCGIRRETSRPPGCLLEWAP